MNEPETPSESPAPPAPWDRQPGESAPAHEALLIYLAAGAKRSAQSTADVIGKSASLVRGWSAEHAWVERAAAFDSHNAGVEQAARDKVRATTAALWEQRRIDDCESVYKLGMLLRERSRCMLEYPLADREVTERDAGGRETKVTIKSGPWSFATAATLAKASVDMTMLSVDVALADDDTFDASTATAEECQAYVMKHQARRRASREALQGVG